MDQVSWIHSWDRRASFGQSTLRESRNHPSAWIGSPLLGLSELSNEITACPGS